MADQEEDESTEIEMKIRLATNETIIRPEKIQPKKNNVPLKSIKIMKSFKSGNSSKTAKSTKSKIDESKTIATKDGGTITIKSAVGGVDAKSVNAKSNVKNDKTESETLPEAAPPVMVSPKPILIQTPPNNLCIGLRKSVKTHKNQFAMNRLLLMLMDVKPESLCQDTIDDLKKMYSLLVNIHNQYIIMASAPQLP